MTEPTTAPVAPLPLFSRAVGMVTSPKTTYQNVTAAPRPFGILFVCALLIGIGGTIPQLTEAARVQSLEMQLRGMERFGMTVTPEMQQQMEARSHSKLGRILGAIGPLIMFPILALLLAAVFWAAFNGILGGTATFKQVLAVTTHSYVITALAVLASVPVLLYQYKLSMGGPFNLGALAPMLDESSPVYRFLSSVGIFSLWAWFVVAIGLGVLYRRKTRNIAIVLLALSLVFTYAMASIFGSFFGS